MSENRRGGFFDSHCIFPCPHVHRGYGLTFSHAGMSSACCCHHSTYHEVSSLPIERPAMQVQTPSPVHLMTEQRTCFVSDARISRILASKLHRLEFIWYKRMWRNREV